ncbi:TIGR03621 family F420-dependent LLM class oxidoreductase [Georgenia alba]|uniref:TIGR03621 family F420-dependent LLM class oxidoreductase n=1 Tax=Georgenia alba TaxID=2233858 RepID=A0ABW2Q995_9MICO
MVSVAVQAAPRGSGEWLDLARTVEESGFDTLYAADHPGATPAPFVTLAAASAVTRTLRLGTYVVNAGVREPHQIAVDAATLDVVSGGRAVLGIGAGHTPAEWQAVGRDRPGVAGRVARCEAVALAVRDLLRGEEVTARGPHVSMTGRLTNPRPIQDPLPLLVGTSNSRLLRFAGEHADVVGLAGLGRTLPDGHQHEVRWTPEVVDEQVALVEEGARAAGRDRPQLEALVQLVAVTDDVDGATAEVAEQTGIAADRLLEVPYVLAGTEDEIVGRIEQHHRRWGITRFVVRRDAVDVLAPLLPRLAAIG